MSFEYGEPQVAVAITFGVLALILAVTFVVVARRTTRDVALEEVQRRGYWLRKRWLAFLSAALVVVVGGSLFLLPYASGGAGSRTVIRVTGGQFYFLLDPAEVPLGTRARLVVTSKDVNHGLGLYDPNGHMVGSVQAMPGYHNKLDVTLRTPGDYRLLCFEYCGLGHHAMQAVLRVVR